MNIHFKVIFVVFLLSILSNAQQPEFYFHLKDNPGANYTIFAEKEGINPVFDGDFLPTNEYDTEYEKVDGDGVPILFFAGPNGTSNRGFDWATDNNAGQDNRGILGLGIYKIYFERETFPGSGILNSVFSFYLDVRQTSWSWSPDLVFQYERFFNGETYQVTLTVSGSNNPPRVVTQNSLVELWTEINEEKDWSGIVYNSTLTNDFEGYINQNTPISFEDAPAGFPFETYSLGHIFPVQSNANFWKNTVYTLSVTDQVTNYNNKDYKARHWNLNPLSGEYGNMADVKIVGEETKVFFNPTLPLTVTNNLEGVNGGIWGIEWEDKPIDLPQQISGIPFNAFDYEKTGDLYSITAPDFNFLNTNWYFLYWERDRSIYRTKTGIQVKSSTNNFFTANYKGHFRSDTQTALGGNGHRCLLQIPEGGYYFAYNSLNDGWFTYAYNFNSDWAPESKLASFWWTGLNGKLLNPSMVNVDEYTAVAAEYYNPTENIAQIILSYSSVSPPIVIDGIDVNYFGQANPVIAAADGRLFVVYRKNSSGGLYYKYSTDTYWTNWQGGMIPNTNSMSVCPSIVGEKTNPSKQLHICWSDQNSIYYYRSYYDFNKNQQKFADYAIVSSGKGFIFNYSPSISLYYPSTPIISWTGGNTAIGWKITGDEGTSGGTRAVVSGSNWSNSFISGQAVGYVNNNSVEDTSPVTLIVWSENNGQSAKWVKRLGADFYSTAQVLQHPGKYIQISNGTNLQNMKAITFLSNESAPYIINLSETDFSGSGGGVSKVNDEPEISYCRSGIITKNQIEFVFSTGDILLADTVIKFINCPDTLQYSRPDDLNQVLKSLPFVLNQNSELYFSNIYYVIREELADSLLTEEDIVSFRVELVKSLNDEVTGTFDNITYNKYNLSKYANVNYRVDCTGIQEGEYYLRLKVAVNGEADYTLANVQNDYSEFGKKNYYQINFDGKLTPTAYDLSQNFPNPFNPATTINYQLPQNGFVTLRIYDILGKEVKTLVNEQKNQGRYSVNFDASRLASGVYIYQLRANDYVSSKKMLLLK